MLASENEIANLLYTEARFLDEQKYQDWLELYTDDAVYWLPAWINATEVVPDPKKGVSLIYLDRKQLETYIKRIYTGDAYAFSPPSRTNRIVSNIEVAAVMEANLKVFAKWQMYVYRFRNLYCYTGSTEYGLRRQDKLKIFYKKVILVNDWVRDGQLMII